MTDKEKFDCIVESCTEVTTIDRDRIFSKSRKQEVAYARHMIVFFSKKHTFMTLKHIAIELGRSDHSTMINSINKYNDLFTTLASFRNLAKKVGEVIAERLAPGPYQRYFDIVLAAMDAFMKENLFRRQSDHCFMGTYVFFKTGIRNTGWYDMLVSGVTHETTMRDIKCFRSIDYKKEEIHMLLDKFDNAEDEFVGLIRAAEAAYQMEDWSEVEQQVNLIKMIQDPELIKTLSAA